MSKIEYTLAPITFDNDAYVILNHDGILWKHKVGMITFANGNQAMALVEAVSRGYCDSSTVIGFIKEAKGDQAMAVSKACLQGWWPKEDAIEFIKTARGDQAQAAFALANRALWPMDDFLEFLKIAKGNRLSAVIKFQRWRTARPKELEGLSLGELKEVFGIPQDK